MNILKEIIKAQRLICVKKTDWNEYGKYRYRNAETILAEVKKALSPEIGIIPKYEISDDEKRLTLELRFTDGEENYTHSSVVLIDTHKGMSREQCVGAAYSYCLKYALCAVFLIDNGEEVDKLPPKQDIETEKVNIEKVAARAKSALKKLDTETAIKEKTAEMVAQMPKYKAVIEKVSVQVIDELNALNDENTLMANSRSEE